MEREMRAELNLEPECLTERS